jgi:hypothetical protein
MDEVTRREAIGTTGVAAAVALAGLTSPARADDSPAKEADEKLDRQRVLACGFTEAEADCWLLLNQMGAKFFALPKLHEMDDHELAHAIHVLQYRLLSRPAYRKYKELAKGEKK